MQNVDKKKNESNGLSIWSLVVWLFHAATWLIIAAFIILFVLRVGTAVEHLVRTESDKLADFYETYDSCMQKSVNKDVCTLKAIEAYN